MALHFQCIPTELEPDQVQDYLYELQQRSKTPSQTYFKHTVYGLRFLLKTEGLPYGYLKLPAIKKSGKLPVVLSGEEIWQMLKSRGAIGHDSRAAYPDALRYRDRLWGQNLSLHPHLHCIVPGGGINKNGQWQKQLRSNRYLFAVKALSKVFRAKYVQQLRANGVDDKTLIESLFKMPWIVYAKRPFGGPAQVIEYLGRYTHKVAISNHRILAVTSTAVTFSYKDYRTKGITKQMTLSNEELTRRFAQHILPHRLRLNPFLENALAAKPEHS